MTVTLMLALTSACSLARIGRVEPARCRDLPPLAPPARVTEVMSAAATVMATAAAAGPAALDTAAATNPAVSYARGLMASATRGPARAANAARETQETAHRRELATAMPRDARLAALEAAFRDRSARALDAFLDDWEAEVRPHQASELRQLSPAERSAYELFAEFLRPGAVPAASVDRYRRGPPALPLSGHVVVQTVVGVRCTATSLAELPRPTTSTDLGDYEHQLDDFRPPLAIGLARPLYLTPDREVILTSFLGRNHGLGPDDAGIPDRPEAETAARAEFLRQRMPLVEGHWGGWHLATDPTVGLTFNEDMTAAWVEFQQGYEGGTARAELRHGRWVIVESQWEWIE